MTETKFTKGPWFIDSKLIVGPRIDSDGQDNGFISEVCDASLSIGNKKANANLIAAAPDLYEALQRLVNVTSEIAPDVQGANVFTDARAALAKARGEL